MTSRNQRGWIVPGFHLPLKWQQEEGSGRDIHRTFLNAALDGSEDGGDGFQPLTVEERLMLSLMNELTDDPSWVQSMDNVAFLEAWKDRSLFRERVSHQMVEWCLQEVRDRVVPFRQHQFLPALDHGINKSDTVIGPALSTALQRSLKRLERVSKQDKTYGPQAAQTMIVDPCLYPLRFGLTKYYSSPMSSFTDCIRLSGKGMSRNLISPKENGTLDERSSYKIKNAFSLRYQMLPCDVHFKEETGKARIASYIENVHPLLDRDVYTAANKLLTTFIPMLNSTLIAVKTSQLFYPRIDPEKRTSRENLPDPEPGPYRSCESRLRSGKLIKDGKLPTSIRVDLQKEFWDIGIQAVIQVSSVDLDQERPEYPGEDWHVQDLMSLNSLTRTTKETEEVYGVEDLKPAIQELGSVIIREGRVISFPNVFQTKINPIKLYDSTKPGHLKMFVMHLIDPNRRIMSTSMVPCQRRDWWAREIRQKVPVLRRLPMEIFDHIIDMGDDFPVSSIKAEEMREEMMHERAEL
ncbi:MAG: hypothetical protein Q9207_002297 [Kuettlingeria erythrocarpa]